MNQQQQGAYYMQPFFWGGPPHAPMRVHMVQPIRYMPPCPVPPGMWQTVHPQDQQAKPQPVKEQKKKLLLITDPESGKPINELAKLDQDIRKSDEPGNAADQEIDGEPMECTDRVEEEQLGRTDEQECNRAEEQEPSIACSSVAIAAETTRPDEPGNAADQEIDGEPGECADHRIEEDELGHTAEQECSHAEEQEPSIASSSVASDTETTSTSSDLGAMVYDRLLVMCVRDFIRESKHVECPVSEKELMELGLDVKSMPLTSPMFKGKQSNKSSEWKQRRADNQHVPGKTSSTGRTRHNGPRDQPRGAGRHSANRPGDVVIERQKPLQPSHRAEKAYKVVKDVDELTKIAKDVRGLLNKITPTTYPVLSVQFLERELYKSDEVRAVVLDIIFDKAVEEPKFCPMYSDLCKLQADEESKKDRTQSFRNGIITKAQKTFEMCDGNVMASLEKELEDEQDATKKKALEQKIVELKSKEKRRIHGNIGFIDWCLIHLLRADEDEVDEPSIECAVKMMTSQQNKKSATLAERTAAGTKEQDAEFDKYIVHLHNKAKEGRYCPRIRFSISDLMDLKNNKWVPRKSAQTGPKTVKEIHEEVKREEIENQAAREKFEEQQNRRMRENAHREHLHRDQYRRDHYHHRDHHRDHRREQEIRPKPKFIILQRDQPGKASNTSKVVASSSKSFKEGEAKTKLATAKASWTRGASGGGSTPSAPAAPSTPTMKNRFHLLEETE
ncbi:hypothetical protein QR680_004869 [Steinernema hermaphroditum]|uniref:MIF4G domain-containing protein n=1 Tax=Steinernema hermaphroditum TaxID=289476 RepID=A0AA39LUD7_9BILA|nr:hypothetical protein QR680_004869 [Steinernema hermaphroditum]